MRCFPQYGHGGIALRSALVSLFAQRMASLFQRLTRSTWRLARSMTLLKCRRTGSSSSRPPSASRMSWSVSSTVNLCRYSYGRALLPDSSRECDRVGTVPTPLPPSSVLALEPYLLPTGGIELLGKPHHLGRGSQDPVLPFRMFPYVHVSKQLPGALCSSNMCCTLRISRMP